MSEVLDAKLRARGMRATPQRRLVLAALTELGHATPEQVDEHLRALEARSTTGSDGQPVNLSTVYRTLELLEQLGLVSHAHLTHGAPTYQVASHADHFHLVCRGCGAVVEADLGPARELAAAVQANHGFAADLAHLSLHGWCADCQVCDQGANSEESNSQGSNREGMAPAGRLHRHD